MSKDQLEKQSAQDIRTGPITLDNKSARGLPFASTAVRTERSDSVIAALKDSQSWSTSGNNQAANLFSEDMLGHGYFQRRILVCVQLSMALVVVYNVSVKVFSFPVDHWCKPPPEFPKMSPGQWKNMAIPITDDCRYDQCHRYDLRSPGPNSARPMIACEAWDYDLPPERETIISFWNLVCERSRLILMAHGFEFVGSSLLLPLVGQTTDRLGRRPVIFFCVVAALVSGFVSSVARRFTVFVVARALVAASVNALKLVTYVLLLEVTSSKRRELYCCLPHLGSVAAFAAVTMLRGIFLDRQVVNLLTMLPMSFLVFTFYAVKESPRWLVSVNDIESAEDVLLFVSQMNSLRSGSVKKQLSNVTREPKKRAPFSFVQLLSILTLRNRTLALAWAWLCVDVSIYTLISMYTSFGSQSGEPEISRAHIVPSVGAILGAYGLLKICDRKTILYLLVPLSFMLTVLSAACSVVWGKLRVVFMLVIISSALEATNVVLYVYTFEMFPTVVRVMGISVTFLCGRVGATLGYWLFHLTSEVHPSVPMLIISLAIISSLAWLHKLPESKGAKLPETLLDLDL